MDNSVTRYGQPCWFRVPESFRTTRVLTTNTMLQVGMVAVNDGILLLNHIHKILRKYFRKLYYVDLVDLSKEENYGKPDPSNAANVKDLYKELDLEGVFMEYESETYEKLNGVIEAHQSKPIQEVLKSLLAEIYKRHK